jgi:hypothetical protein
MLKDGIKRMVNDFPEPDTRTSNAEFAKYAER